MIKYPKSLSSIVLAILFCSPLFSQKIPLIKSGEVIDRGKQLYDSGKYEASALQLLKVSKQDTNYVYMLSELALTYIGDKKFDQAIEVCNEGLAIPSEFGSHLWRSKGIAADKKGDFETSVKYFQEGISKYPFDHSMIFNLGITYYNHKDYDKAEDCFFRALTINPFHPGSHLNLSRLAMGKGRKTHAALAMGMYLSLNSEDNERLVLLNKFFGNEVTDEGNIPVSGVNSCEKLDQIVRARIAMDKKFDSKIPIDAAVVKQFELIFNQLSLVTPVKGDRYVDYYLATYKTLKEKNLVEPFIYYLLSSSSNEVAKKWRKKNDKEINAFFQAANVELKEKRKEIEAPATFQYSGPVPAWHNSDSHKLEAIGKKTDDKRQGQWFFFHSDYEKSAEGKYNDSGKKIGTWKYYYADGRNRSVENYENGEVTVFFGDGGKKEHFFLANDEIEGVVELYYPCGTLQEKLNYKNGKRDGKGEAFSSFGAKTTAFNYKEDKLEGEYTTYYASGELESKKKYAAGELDGLYQDFFKNGKIQTTGEMVKGNRNSVWKTYYASGQLDHTGTYTNGLATGEWLFYEKNGALSEKRVFDQKGNWQGESTTYYNGKPVNVKTFKNDVLVKIVCYDTSGKELGKFESSNGTFAGKTFYANGQLAGEGRYKKGKLDGPWVYYYPDGSKWKEYKYVDGLVQGESIEYFKTGSKKFLTNYKDNQYHGYFQEFFKNGQVKQEGWFQDGQRQQQWLVYHENGALESDYYYFNDEFHGPNKEFNILGKLYSNAIYKNGDLVDVEEFNENGKKISTQKTANNKTTFEVKYASGKTKTVYEVECGHYHGKISVSFPNGNTFYSYRFNNGRRNGEYKYMTTENNPDWMGRYEDGQEEGIWQGYTGTGKLDSKGKFVVGERDSIWNNYYINGKISSAIAYKNGEREGVSKYFTTEGNAMLEKLYEEGQLVAYRIYKNGNAGEWLPAKKDMSIIIESANGTKLYEEVFKSGSAEGAKRIFYENGKLYSEYNFKDGDYEGAYKILYPNGQVEEQGEYKNDQLTGTRKFFKEDGKILKSEEYVSGSRHGSSISYNNGIKANEVVFWGGSPQK